MKIILKLLEGYTVKLLGGYIPPIPPGFGIVTGLSYSRIFKFLTFVFAMSEH